MKQIDREALELCLKMVLESKAEPGRPDQVRAFLREDGWEVAAKFCSSLLQRRNLQMRPWDPRPPCRSEPDDGTEPGRLLARMLAAGVSRFDPDPLAALERANDKTATDPGQLLSTSGVRHDSNTRGTED